MTQREYTDEEFDAMEDGAGKFKIDIGKNEAGEWICVIHRVDVDPPQVIAGRVCTDEAEAHQAAQDAIAVMGHEAKRIGQVLRVRREQ